MCSTTTLDVEAVWPEIEADLSRIESRRENAKIEHARLWRRGEVERLHRELDRSRFYCFPSLHQFRKLPTLRIFQDGTLGPENVSWRNDFVDGLVTNDIQEWAAKMVKEFSERLGYPGWVPTNTLTNPVHWISSRFMCTRCSKSGPKVTRNKSLSFAEAAHHTCVVSEMGNKDQWSPENFVVDAKVSPPPHFSQVFTERLEGNRSNHPIYDWHRPRCTRENRGGLCGHFTRCHVSLVFRPHRDVL